jgi:hypothetical protein
MLRIKINEPGRCRALLHGLVNRGKENRTVSRDVQNHAAAGEARNNLIVMLLNLSAGVRRGGANK